MKVHSPTRIAAIALLVGALACAGNTARDGDTDETAAARDTTMSDTLGGDGQYRDRGMEGDSVNAPQYPETSDTFLQNQGPGAATDTSGYSGMERMDTTGQAQQDTSSFGGDTTRTSEDTSGMTGQDTTGMTGTDTSWSNQSSGDTTGYDPSQLPQDTTSSR